MLMHKLSAYVCWKVAMDKNGAAQKKYSPIKQVIMYINLKTIFPPNSVTVQTRMHCTVCLSDSADHSTMLKV